MKSKAPLTLMELLIMLLVFALAAAFCLQTFAAAHRISGESLRMDAAVTSAQNAAEMLKNCDGDFEKAAARLGGTWDGERWTLAFDDHTLYSVEEETSLSLLGQAKLIVTDRNGELLYELPVSWQKEVSSYD